ncbi:MAG: UPF0182 family protein [Gemmatimonadetes bacterium]|nr:UPF0182 family protein [Gemmatimonadota bacterium]
MTPRARRLLAVGGAVVVLLILGRLLAVLLTARWWAAAISPAAAQAVSEWMLLGWMLELGAIAVASAWFIAHALWVVRGIASVTLAQRVGQEEIPVAISPRALTLWAVGMGVLLGGMTGTGARTWRAPIALAWQGLRFGRLEPTSGADLGVFVAQLPVWQIGYDYFVTLVVLALAMITLLYTITGGIRRQGGQLVVHPHSRYHLGALITVLAIAVGVGAMLHPWLAVAAMQEPLPMVVVSVRELASQALMGAAIAVAVMSATWALRGRTSLLLAGWIVLGTAMVVERWVVPAMSEPTAPVPTADADIRNATADAWGINAVAASVATDTLPPVTGRWDQTTLRQVVDGQGATLLAVTPGSDRHGDTLSAVWHLAIARSTRGPVFEALTVRDARAPLQDSSSIVTRIALDRVRVRPGAPEWQATASGVSTSGVFRRIMLAWGRQAGGLLRPSPSGRVDWLLDPSDRAAALMPMVSWLPGEMLIVEGRAVWVVQGVIPLSEYPLATHGRWGGRAVAGVKPGFIALMEPESGAVRVYLDPAADALAKAWARILGPLVETSPLPQPIIAELRYPRLLMEAQLRILEGPAWHFGKRPGRREADGPPESPVPVWSSTDGPGWQSAMEDPARQALATILTASRRAGIMRLEVGRQEGPGAENAREAERRWNRLPILSRWRDSARAARDSIIPGTVRWYPGPRGLMAWQPIIAVNRFGRVTALAVAASVGERATAARDPESAWAELLGDPGAPKPPESAVAEAERWLKAREWMARADSALARGDLTAFGRAFEALRKLLAPEPPK